MFNKNTLGQCCSVPVGAVFHSCNMNCAVFCSPGLDCSFAWIQDCFLTLCHKMFLIRKKILIQNQYALFCFQRCHLFLLHWSHLKQKFSISHFSAFPWSFFTKKKCWDPVCSSQDRRGFKILSCLILFLLKWFMFFRDSLLMVFQ